jgi:DNA-binding IclR family transcriptional regulator
MMLLRSRLDDARHRKVGFASDEFSPGISAVAAPIFDASGPVAALIVSGHDMQDEPHPESRLVSHMLRVAHLIGDVLTSTGSGSS